MRPPTVHATSALRPIRAHPTLHRLQAAGRHRPHNRSESGSGPFVVSVRDYHTVVILGVNISDVIECKLPDWVCHVLIFLELD